MRVIVLAVALIWTAATAAAQEVAAGISRDTIEITSNFTGTDIVVFGAIEKAVGEDAAATSVRDIVVVIRSDKPFAMTVRKKERIGPIWANRMTRQYAGVPGFYFVASTKPLPKIAADGVLEEFELGLGHVAIGPAPGAIGGPREFREAIIRAKQRAELYSEHPGGVIFLSDTLFRTTAALPANVPAGNLKILVYAFSGGQVISSNSMTLFIDKTGIERRLSNFAFEQPWLYGIAAVFLSAFAGFLSSLAFRERD